MQWKSHTYVTDAIAEDSDTDEEDQDILHEEMVNALLFFNVG